MHEINPPAFFTALSVGSFKANAAKGLPLALGGVGLLCPLASFFLFYSGVIYLFSLALYLLLAAAGLGLIKLAWPFLAEAWSDFAWAKALANAEQMAVSDEELNLWQGLGKGNLKVEFTTPDGTPRVYELDDQRGRRLFGQAWARAKERFRQERALPPEAFGRWRDYCELDDKLHSLLVQQGYEAYEIELERTSLRQMREDFLVLLSYRQLLLQVLAAKEGVEAKLAETRLDMEGVSEGGQRALLQQSVQLLEARLAQLEKQELALGTAELEIQAMEHRLALMQDSLLCKADLGAGGRRYVPTPLLQELKRMVDSRGAQACGE